MKRNMTTYARKETVKHDWYVIDAAGMPLGRVANKAAVYLRGKHKAIFTPHVDTGDFIIVINAAKVRLTGNKLAQKVYRHHTGYPGGLVEISAKRMMERNPETMVREAVLGMLPKNKLGKAMGRKLMVYRDDKHPHEGQKPEPYRLLAAK